MTKESVKGKKLTYDVEKRIHEKNSVRQKGRRVQQDRLGWAVERVGVENGLDHDQRLSQIFFGQGMTVKSRLVWTVVENLGEAGCNILKLRDAGFDVFQMYRSKK